MELARYGTRFKYESRRRWPQAGLAFSATVEVGRPVESTELDLFLTSRWGLHSTLLGKTVWIPNWHLPWKLHAAELVSLKDDLSGAAGVTLNGEPDVPTRYAPGVQTIFGPPTFFR